jgi:hypothetical protein
MNVATGFIEKDAIVEILWAEVDAGEVLDPLTLDDLINGPPLVRRLLFVVNNWTPLNYNDVAPWEMGSHGRRTRLEETFGVTPCFLVSCHACCKVFAFHAFSRLCYHRFHPLMFYLPQLRCYSSYIAKLHTHTCGAWIVRLDLFDTSGSVKPKFHLPHATLCYVEYVWPSQNAFLLLWWFSTYLCPRHPTRRHTTWGRSLRLRVVSGGSAWRDVGQMGLLLTCHQRRSVVIVLCSS